MNEVDMYQDFFNKNDDYLDEFRQKVAEQKIATMEERRVEMARSRNNFLGTFAGIVLAGVVGWFVLAPQYQQTQKEIPTIRRPQTAVKIKPENPGGMEIPNQDKEVYNIVEKKESDNMVVENLLPTPEQPKLPDIVPEPEEETAPELNENASNLDEIVSEVTDKAEEAKKATEAVIPAKPDDLLADKKEAVADTAKEPKNEIKKEAEKTEQAKPETGKGGWQIQLVASKNKGAVENTWKSLSARYELLKSYSYEIQSADLGTQGM
ncbi:MAG: hypothetical protein ILA52_00490, partial [Alphaproteobacteria bacterium]|nr:hypothetical protein [Alphaproteobacteria bacterium]